MMLPSTNSLLKILKNKLVSAILISLLAAMFLSSIFYIGVFEGWQLRLSDSLFTEKKPLDNIVILAVDDNSLQEIGRWPWPREVFAKLFPMLKDAKVVGVDIAFFEDYDQDVDIQLGKALSGINAVIPVEYSEFEDREGILYGTKLLKPILPLQGNADPAFINIFSDMDGVARKAPLHIEGVESYDGFALAIYNKFRGKKTVFDMDRLIINFVGKPGSFITIPITDVLNNRSDISLENKIILIGATAPDLHDDFFVPTSGGKAMPGVEVHANALQTLMTKDFLVKEPSWMVIISMLIIAFLIPIMIKKFNTWLSFIISFLLLLGYVAAAVILFDNGFIINVVYVPLSIALTYMVILIFFFIMEQKEKKHISDAFGKYVSPVVIQELMKNPEKLKLGGERKEITILFSDIRGFTSISEKLSPEDLVTLLNEYLTAMTEIIIKNNGVVDKFIGDAIMAFWGAPIDEKDNAELACRTALEMIEKLAELQQKWKKENLPHIEIGVGINTGGAVIGNMGSYNRFDYTAMGDNVNLGSRLEGLNKEYGTNILVSEHTKEKISLPVREIDSVRVKGKQKPVRIYELVSRRESFMDSYEKGLDHYRNKRWDKAIAEFKKALKAKKDPASEIFIERCHDFKKLPPGKGWDGVFILTKK